MQALIMTRYGGPDAVELRHDVAQPVAGPGEVLVQVFAASLNPVDYKIREGQLRPIRRYRFPLVMGNDIAGVVQAVGAGVSRFTVGDRVYSSVGAERLGGLAQWAAVPADRVAPMPAGLTFEQAAAVPLTALTAYQALHDELQLRPGQRLFISGGAGGVGTLAIQLAKHWGASVATTASPRGEALVRRLGADVVIDYTRQRFDQVLQDYDAAFDLIGGDDLNRTFGILRRGALLVSIAGMPEPQTAQDLGGGRAMAAMFWLASLRLRRLAAKHGIRYRYLFKRPSGADLEQITGLIEADKLQVIIDRTYPLEEVKQAFQYLERGRAKGKVVISITS